MNRIILFAMLAFVSTTDGCFDMDSSDFLLDWGDWGWHENDPYEPYVPQPTDKFTVTLVSPDTLTAGSDTTITVQLDWKIVSQPMTVGRVELTLRDDSTSDCIKVYNNDSKSVESSIGSETVTARVHVEDWAVDVGCTPTFDGCLRINNWQGRWTWCAQLAVPVKSPNQP